jgi:hypothetical protein
MKRQFRTWAAVTGAATVAIAGLLIPAAAGAATVHTTPLRTMAASGKVGGPRSEDKATQVHMNITNNTGQPLNLTSATHSGKDTAWQNRPAQTLGVGASTTASVYSAGDAQIDITYTGASDGATFKLEGITPLSPFSKDSASGTSSSASYFVNTSHGSGYNPTDDYTMEPGGTFNYTGQSTTYTVPVGVTQLKVEAIGGGTDNTGSNRGTGGADVTGALAVTPGEQLTIGVGGQGGSAGPAGPNPWAGGWGMTIDGDNFSGGNTNDGGHDIASSPGGGATVVTDSSSGNVLLVVAGGGGGDGAVSTDCDTAHQGGDGGAGFSWTGGNGNPWPGGGGQAGANTTTQGQASDTADDCQGGAGGGGFEGGLAGVDGGGAGGGAGSSAASGLTGADVASRTPGGGNAGGAGEVIISAAR